MSPKPRRLVEIELPEPVSRVESVTMWVVITCAGAFLCFAALMVWGGGA